MWIYCAVIDFRIMENVHKYFQMYNSVHLVVNKAQDM